MWRIKLIQVSLLAILIAGFVFPRVARAEPLLANYYLSDLPTDSVSIDKLSKFNVLIIQPWEAIVRASVVKSLKEKNPSLILLAYVPSKSYDSNWQNYPANLVYGDFKVQDAWLMRDPNGNITSDWPGHENLNLDPSYTNYLVSFLQNKVFSTKLFDGIFFDVVYDSISWQNGGNLDLNNDGRRDDPATLDQEWTRRMKYLLETSRNQLNLKYVVFNGTSIAPLQADVNGRMYENFPTPWEANGSWSGLMNKLTQNQAVNLKPELYIFNGNTNNTGAQNDYRNVRFGLGSSLLTDNVYFGFDYGNKDHGQVWWYDEYDAHLGNPLGPASGVGPEESFKEDVWRRDFQNGLVLVNATPNSKTIDLGGDFERISGTQDPLINDGSVGDSVTLAGKDALIMYKTYKTLSNGVFINGSFARFFNATGNRSRNGFFVYENNFAGGAKIYNGDIDGDGRPEKIVATGQRLEIYSGSGGRWYNDYPFGANLKSTLNIAIGKLNNDSRPSLIVTNQGKSGKVMIFNYQGSLVKDQIYPLGKKYSSGFSVAVAKVNQAGRIILGTGRGVNAEVLEIDSSGKILTRWSPYAKKYTGGIIITTGNFAGSGQPQVATVNLTDLKPLVRIFDLSGKKLQEFTVSGWFGRQQVAIAGIVLNATGKSELVVMSNN